MSSDISFKIEDGILKCFHKDERVYFKSFNYDNVMDYINEEDVVTQIDCLFILNCKGDIVIEIGKIKKYKNEEYDVLILDTYDYKYYEFGRKEYEYIISFGVITENEVEQNEANH